MGYLVTILGVLGSIAANFAALRYFIKPIQEDIVEIKGDIKELRHEIRRVDEKYDKKTDQIRVDIFNLARDMNPGQYAGRQPQRWRSRAEVAA